MGNDLSYQEQYLLEEAKCHFAPMRVDAYSVRRPSRLHVWTFDAETMTKHERYACVAKREIIKDENNSTRSMLFTFSISRGASSSHSLDLASHTDRRRRRRNDDEGHSLSMAVD